MSIPTLQRVYNTAFDGQSEPSLMSANVLAEVWDPVLKHCIQRSLYLYRQIDMVKLTGTSSAIHVRQGIKHTQHSSMKQ
jgi:hypothetical protein